ncbi:5-formyltetrahydrofolate cyclo-ligase [Thalassospira sp. MBR-102]|jgi:5-formyltetrahydrofolate cyclo-ligase|uniref:5-formyltetrahydrofolate cyclo-ligase n=1 Tax=Thalassospira TaxID=168934 RepID=UPI0008DDE5A5|nr:MULTISPECIES: 5-formyltetrahydrofolate cyclo-ligase [Thalassospira]MAB33696.1 5-formyltetrahydrofolate cyclo-ligase [Thalassospira sp.]MBA04833.1 5-formyltetrahydrofolate cyclo-ligase [Thalassospira sp.]MDM7977205.1 5-formyltetrahydrofolate cyclo-ligase [Thalassospira xiamenensis]OHY99152.1 5-formyltetrahydrofolate cyclo-ligase [Thalassospira sp. MIT1004]
MTRIILPAPPNVSDDAVISEWRKSVRKKLLAWRGSIDPAIHRQWSVSVCNGMTAILAERPKATVGFYWPIQNEIDLRPVIVDHIARGGKAALPVVPAKAQPMIFHDWTPQTEIAPGFASIPEPVGTKEAVPIHVMIAPLVGFDGRGYRLGYGGGFFDRTLAAMAVRPLVIGVGFEATRIADIFPHEYDIPVDIILTEAGIRPVSEKATGDFNRAEGASPPCFLSS